MSPTAILSPMKARLSRYATVVVIALLSVVSCAPAEAEDTFVVPNSYIIQRNASYAGALSEDQVRYTVEQSSEHFEVVLPHGYEGQMAAAARTSKELIDPRKVEADCAEILKDPTIAACEPNCWRKAHAVPNDPSFNLEWHLRDSSSYAADVKAPRAWDYGTGGAATLVGVIDSGINVSHPDLSPNLWINPGEPVDGIDNDANGYVDDVSGVNTHFRTSNPEDLQGHGTHVSGIIAARGNNGSGVSGVMWQGSLIVASIANGASNQFSGDAVLQAYYYFYDLKRAGHNVRVVNASFGGDDWSLQEYNAINSLRAVDILLVAAAGNEPRSLDSIPHYPASYDLDNIITVAATGPTGQLSYYSTYGQTVDIAAPGGDIRAGVQIYSTVSPSLSSGASYAYNQGTSMAAPVVTGAIGLLASQRPSLSGAQLKALILSTADSLPQLASYVKSGRFLNIGAAAASEGAADLCPSDPNKSEAGACGCGVADTDTDSDGTADCLDSCASDGQKRIPGACGCGVADTDSDGDGTPDCTDGCRGDGEKTGGGLCGCGVSDADDDGNGTVDCQDPQIIGVTPPPPALTSAKGKATITMTPKDGVKYFLKVVVQDPKGKKLIPKPKTTYYSSHVASRTITKLKSKAKLTVSYAYYYQGSKTVSSSYSQPKRISVK